MEATLSEEMIQDIVDHLQIGNYKISQAYPGFPETRQPVHTVYGGAHLYKYNTTQKLGELALLNLQENAPDATVFAQALGIPETIADKVYARVKDKLKREAVEDFRIDFEDGFGHRPNEEEDETASQSALQVSRAMKEGTLSPFIGIRIKQFSEELKLRSIRTLDIFVTALARETQGSLPPGFVITLPKVTHALQIKALIELFHLLESKTQIGPGALKMEFMVETPQSIFGPDGDCVLSSFVDAAEGRCVGAHFGTYDYTASVSVTAEYQAMDHPACDFARHMMKVALAGRGIWLSDGATNVIPVGPHKSEKGGPDLTTQQMEENRSVVHGAWRLSNQHIQHSLKNAFYQGWDLHPAQLPVRYGALYSFFLDGLDSSSSRLRAFVEQAAQATLLGDIFDDAATGQGLLNYFLRALNCGAITENEILSTGLTLEELQTRSFLKIIEGRRMKK